MSEKDQSKRGILASLLGLFGEEDEENADKQTGFESLERPSGAWTQPAAELEADAPAAPHAPRYEPPAPSPAPAPAPPAPDDRPVVRESYEPGWYAVSTSLWAPPVEEPQAEAGPQPEAESPADAAPHVEADLREAEPQAPVAPLEPEKRFVPGDVFDREGEPAPEPVLEAAPPSPIEPVAIPQPIEHAAEPEAAEAPTFSYGLPVGADEHAGWTAAELRPLEPPAPEAPEPEPEPELEAAQPEWQPLHQEPEPTPAAQPSASFDQWEPPALAAESLEPEPDPEPEPHPEPAPEPEPVPAAPAHGPDPLVGGLFSRSAVDRREALRAMVERGLTDEEAQDLARLLNDPERDIRREAIEAMAQRPDRVEAGTVRQALLDPTDEVRAAAVRLAGARSFSDVPEVLPVVASRHWPLSQQAALAVIPDLVARAGIDEAGFSSLLSVVGGLDSQPVEAERNGFGALADALGSGRLVEALDRGGREALGAARLLVEEGSTESLRAVAARSDGDEDITIVAQMAADLLGEEAEPEQEVPMDTETSLEAREAEQEGFSAPQAEMVAGLARALHDPDEMVRDRAREALAGLGRETLEEWVQDTLRGRDADQASLAAEVAGVAQMGGFAAQVLERATDLAPEARGPFVRALSSFELNPAAMAGLVHSVESSRRPEAIRVVWQVAGRPALPHLRELLDDSQAAVRVAVLDAFGESGDPSAIEVAAGMLERDSSPIVRATAIQVIGRAGLDQREAALAQALTDPDPDVRATAVEVLPAGMGARAGQLLLDALGDQDERVWRAAIRHLTSLPERDRGVAWIAILRCPESRREELVDTLERTSAEALALLAMDHMSSPDAAERALALTLAGRAGRPESVRGIAGALQDPTPQVRRVAARALTSVRSSDAIPALGRALSDPDLEVRIAAVQALSMIDDDDVLDPLITALKDPEVRVREVAGEALVRWRSPAVARRLAVALSSPSLRRPVGEVLKRMGPAAVDPLVDILLDDDSDLSATVGQLLQDLVGPDPFLDRLSSMDADERMRSVEVLGALGGDRALDGMIRALSDPVEKVRIRAVTLLGDSGSPRAFEAVKQTFLSDPVLEVVAAAEEALRRLQPAGDDGPGGLSA